MVRDLLRWATHATNCFNTTSYTKSFVTRPATYLLRELKSGLFMTHKARLCSSALANILQLGNSHDIYAYTSGRWLIRDELERNSRYVSFNFDMLCKRIVELCPGAVSIASYEKKEGGFNKIFIFTTDNGKRIVARLPTRISGPSRLSTNSEVATITYLKSKTTIPIPNIIDWSDDPSNAVGSEYIIMEHAAGVHLPEVWQKMSGVQKLDFIWSISQYMQQMAALDFPTYGSLYFADLPIDSASKQSFVQGFCIGPHCGTRYWDCNAGEPRYYHRVEPNRGPWSDLSAYCIGLVDAGLSRLPPEDTILDERPSYYGSIPEHARLLGYGREIIQRLVTDLRIQDAAAPTLLHADLHKRNIYVSNDDPTTITGLIDWQSSSIEPAFINADKIPDFVVAGPLSHDQAVDRNTEIYSQAFDAGMKGLVPKLFAAMTLDDTLLRPFRYCHRTWTDGAVAYRDDLIRISERWQELGLAGLSPYPSPTYEELRVHQEELARFNSARKLRRGLVDLLNVAADGWVPNEHYEAATVALMQAYEQLLQAVRSGENAYEKEQELKALWPFDRK